MKFKLETWYYFYIDDEDKVTVSTCKPRWDSKEKKWFHPYDSRYQHYMTPIFIPKPFKFSP